MLRAHFDIQMEDIKLTWVCLLVFLPHLWKGTACQQIHMAGYSITVNSSVSVQEGLCVTIPCTFTAEGTKTFTKSFGYWIWNVERPFYIAATNDKSSHVEKPNFRLVGNPDIGDCTLTITNARKEDEGEFHFRFEHGEVKYSYSREVMTRITVTDLTEEPVISDLGTVIAGVNKTLTCSPPGNCPASFLPVQWKKSNVAGIWKNSPTITFTPSLDDHQQNITCEIRNSRGKTTWKTLLLHVYSPPAMTVIWETNGKKRNNQDLIKVDEGSSGTLRCSIQSNLTVNVTWMDEKNKVLQYGTGKGQELELRLENVAKNRTGVYTCTARNEYVTNSRNISVNVQYPPRIMELRVHSSKGGERPANQQVIMDETETLTLVCRVEDNPTVTVAWVKGEADTEKSKMSNIVLSPMINVTSPMADVYLCLAWNELGFREQHIRVCTKKACKTRTKDSPIIIGMVVGNIIVLILIILGCYFFMKRRTEKRHLEKRLSDSPGEKERTESIYQDLEAEKTDVYDNVSV